MEEQHEVKGRVTTLLSSVIRFPTEFTLRAVRLVLAEGFSQTMVCKELSICRICGVDQRKLNHED